MKSLFPDDAFKNENADEPWKKSETDKMLDKYLSGAHPKRIAQELNRNPKAVRRRLEQFTYNERDRAVKYEPRKRISRKGMRITENEKLIIQEHRSRGLPIYVTARVLQRNPNEIAPDIKSGVTLSRLHEVAPVVDVLLAHQYLRKCCKAYLISDQAYEKALDEEEKFGGGMDVLRVKRKNPVDWPAHIRYLAFYMLFKFWEGEGEPEDLEGALPYGMIKEHKKKKKLADYPEDDAFSTDERNPK